MSAMEKSDVIVLGSKGVIENNALIDPHATKIVYGADVREHITCGFECDQSVNYEAGGSGRFCSATRFWNQY